MIPDRIIEQGTLTTSDGRASVEVRLPWYRALPGSSISEVALTVDGVTAPADSLRWQMNGREYRLDELVGELEQWWFPTDSAVLSGDLPLAADDQDHEVDVELKLYIPYIVTDHGVLRIEERDRKTMTAKAAQR